MHGLYLLWWIQEKHIPAGTVAVILAIGDLALMALEVPTGWFADKFGHQKSLIAGSAAQVIGMLLCWLGQGVPGLLAASLLVGLGDAFRSGADQALLYRTCLAIERETDFQGIQGRTYAWQAGALFIQVLAGGLIVKRLGFAAGWIVETVVCGIGLGIACAMIEPPHASKRRPDAARKDGGEALPTLRLRVSSLPPLMVVSAVVLSLLDGLAMPLRSVAIQRVANDAVRARVASLASAFDMALKTIALPLAGSWR